MRILITNDDGIEASGLIPLVKWAQKLGEVTVVAPKLEQSGKSQSINIRTPFECKAVELLPGVEAWSVDSAPADCIRFAVLCLRKEFDLVISGINKGMNIGSDILYSGTVGAVFEAHRMGIKGLALSVHPSGYGNCTEHMDEIWDFICQHDLLNKGGPYNINIPKNAAGIRITRQGGPYYSDDFIPQGDGTYKAKGKPIYTLTGDLSIDIDAAMDGYITVTPVTLDRTDHEAFRRIT